MHALPRHEQLVGELQQLGISGMATDICGPSEKAHMLAIALLQILAGEKGARKAGEEAWVCLGHVVLGLVPSCLQAAVGTTLDRRLLMSVCDQAFSKQRTGTRVQFCFMRAATTRRWVVTTGGRKSCLIYISKISSSHRG
jgi:hypothetical protein